MGFGTKDSTEPEKKTKDEKKSYSSRDGEPGVLYWNGFWVICIIVSIILIIASSFCINDFNENIKKHNLKYPWPKMFDLFPSLCILPIVIIFKITVEQLSKGFVEHCLAKKYKKPKDEQMKELADIYRHKLARHIYKITFYTGITIFGYYVLKDLPYFPKSIEEKDICQHYFCRDSPIVIFMKSPPCLIFIII